jgi:hypothetical protein
MALGAVAVLALGIVFLWVSRAVFAPSSIWGSLVRDFGSLLVASVCVAGLWELTAKRAFFAEIFEGTHLSTELQAAGVVGAQSQWYDDVQWKTMLRAVDHVEIFQAYGVVWRGIMEDELAKFAGRKGTSCTVILPDPQDPKLLQAMAANFRRSEEEIQRRIIDAQNEYMRLFSLAGGDLKYEVWYSSRPPLYSFVILGDRAVVTMYKHNSDQKQVIGFVVRRGGAFFRYIENERNAFVGAGGFARRIAGSAE